MTHMIGKSARVLLLSAMSALLLAGLTSAAESQQTVAVGATTGSALRLRAGASTTSPVITTLNKGIAVAVLDTTPDGWYKVSYNGNCGYVSADFLVIDRDNVFTSYGRVNTNNTDIHALPTENSDTQGALNTDTLVTINGFSNGWYAVTFESDTEGYIRSDLLDLTAYGSSSSSSSSDSANEIVNLAKKYLGVRYKWGGVSPKGFDCSGFTLYVYKQFGYSLPHTASGQWASGIGTKVYSIGELQPGDLVFFNDPSRNAGKSCSHCGIYVGDGRFIHASSSKYGVIISSLTSGYYNRYFKGAIRV